jgi:hypothetical protein
MNVTVGNLNFPDELNTTADDLDELDKNRVIAETVNETFHEFGELVDSIDRQMTQTAGLDFDEFVEMYVLYRKSLNSSVILHRTTHRFLADWQAAEDGGTATDEMDDFNSFGADQLAAGVEEFEDFQPMTQEIWDALGKHLTFATNKINQRQVEAAGSVGLGLWFEQARETWVPSSSRPSGNFMIDTMDTAEMLTREEWISIDPADRGIETPLDPAKIFNTVLVNEVQIELGNEAPYIERIEELQAKVDAGTATDDDERTLEGARFILATMSEALIYLSEVKEEKVLDRLDDNGAPNSIRWQPSRSSKGTLALELLGDMQ